MNNNNHVLDSNDYTIEELFNLFDIDINNIQYQDLKNAKKKVMLVHPDKSKLPSEYFLFYKKAFDIIYKYYNESNKINNKVPDYDITYDSNNYDYLNIQTKISNQKFNEYFENIYLKKINTNTNNWFVNDNSNDIFVNNKHINNIDIMNNVIDDMKNKMKINNNNELININELNFNNNLLYDFEEDDDDTLNYKSSYLFSKLKYEDIRKVHRDQPIFSPADERKINFKNLDDCIKIRNEIYEPIITKNNNEEKLRNKLLNYKMKSESIDNYYQQKNKEFMTYISRLQN